MAASGVKIGIKHHDEDGVVEPGSGDCKGWSGRRMHRSIVCPAGENLGFPEFGLVNGRVGIADTDAGVDSIFVGTFDALHQSLNGGEKIWGSSN